MRRLQEANLVVNSYVYLDWAATAPVHYFAKDYYIPGNPNSQHGAGLQANRALNEARDRIKKCLRVNSGKVIIGGTASQLVDNLMWRIYGLGNYNVLGSAYEHDCFGRWIDYRCIENIKQYIFKNDIVCWMMANNITGTIFPVEQIGKMCRKVGAYYIMDAVAAIGHYPISNDLESFCDCLVTSAHKYSGPQGIGCMWVSDRFAKFLELSDDSHEEYGLIHGTLNVSAAVAMSYAMEHAIDGLEDGNDEHWRSLLGYLEIKLLGNRIDCNIVAKDQPKTHAINALYLPNINADALTQYLSTKSIYISPGHSACASNEDYRVLEAFGLTKEEASQTVRISFGEDTSMEDIDALVQSIVEFKNLFI